MFGIYRIQCKEGNVGKPFHIIFKDIGLLGYLPNMKIIFYQHTNKNICWNPKWSLAIGSKKLRTDNQKPLG